VDTFAPERLIGNEWNDDGWHACPQTGRRRPRAAMMYRRRHFRKQPVVRRGVDNEHAIGQFFLTDPALSAEQYAALPTGGEGVKRNLRECFWISIRHAAETDIHGGRASLKERHEFS